MGAVVVRDGVVLGSAFRGEVKPGEHAEFTLFEQKLAGADLAGATLYTTLEPCTHRNHPKIACADRVIARGIKRVVIGTLDPNARIRGLGELRMQATGIEIMRFLPELVPRIQEMNRAFALLHPIRGHERGESMTHDPVQPGDLGPHGFQIGFTPDGDKVEWLPNDENPDEPFPMLLRRNDTALLNEYNELWEKVWWNRHQNWVHELEAGEAKLRSGQENIFEDAEANSKRIEDKFGRKNLGWNDFEWGLMSGRMSALSWVLGAEWEESLDT